ncbi:MAG: PEPxxWA-CTERM sorting domain-containing protein [Janthinobacterium lividum]
MLKAKLLALCVCPALLTPPAILAVNRPARHAVAHVLHRAADRLDHKPAARPAIVAPAEYASLPCSPILAAGDGGLLPAGPGLAGLTPGGLPLPDLTRVADSGSLFPVGYYGSSGAGGGGFGPAGGGGGSAPGGGTSPGGGTTPGGPGSPSDTSPPSVTPTSPIGGGSTPLPPETGGTPPIGSVPGSGGTSNGTVPEPAAWALMIIGFGAIGGIFRFNQRYQLVRRVANGAAGED